MKVFGTTGIQDDVIDTHLKVGECSLVASRQRTFALDFDETFTDPAPEDLGCDPEASSTAIDAGGFPARHCTLLP